MDQVLLHGSKKSIKIVTLYQESSDMNPVSETINVVIKIMDCEKAMRKNYPERIINLETAVFFLCCGKSVSERILREITQ